MTKDAHKTLELIKRFVKNDFAIISDFYPIQDLLDLKKEVKNIINAYLIKANRLGLLKIFKLLPQSHLLAD